MRTDIIGFSFSDAHTEIAMREIEQQFGYTIDPHGAVGYLALRAYQKDQKLNATGIILETAHPAKFLEDVERVLGKAIEVPNRLKELENKEKVATAMQPDFQVFKKWLVEHYRL